MYTAKAIVFLISVHVRIHRHYESRVSFLRHVSFGVFLEVIAATKSFTARRTRKRPNACVNSLMPRQLFVSSKGLVAI